MSREPFASKPAVGDAMIVVHPGGKYRDTVITDVRVKSVGRLYFVVGGPAADWRLDSAKFTLTDGSEKDNNYSGAQSYVTTWERHERQQERDATISRLRQATRDYLWIEHLTTDQIFAVLAVLDPSGATDDEGSTTP